MNRTVSPRSPFALVVILQAACGRLGFDGELDVAPYVAPPVVVCTAPAFTTTSTVDVVVPGLTCDITATDAREKWLVLATAQLAGGVQADPPHVALAVDGEIVSWGEPGTSRGQAWQVFTTIAGTGAPVTHSLELRMNASPSMALAIDEIRIVAIPLGSAAQPVSAQRLGELVIEGVDTEYLAIELDVDAPGRYAVLAGAATSEAPNGSGVNIYVEGPTGPWTVIPYFRKPLIPQIAFRVVELTPGSQRFAVRGYASNTTMATLRDIHMLGFRLPDSAVASTTTAPLSHTLATPLQINSVSAGPATSGSAWLMLGTTLFGMLGDDNSTTGIEFAHDATVLRDVRQSNSGSERYTPSLAMILDTNDPLTVTTSVRILVGAPTLEVSEATTLLLRVP